MRRSAIALASCVLVGISGCGPTNSDQSGRGAGGGTGSGGGGSDTGGGSGGSGGGGGGGGGTDGDGGVSSDANNCGVQNFTLMKGQPPDLLIVLDRSGSMADSPPSGGGSKWSQITAAINSTVSALQGSIEWGLKMFASDDSCGVTPNPDVPVAPNNAAAISSAMAGTMPSSSTPTAAAVHAAGTYLSTVNDGHPKYLLLATDGQPNCAGSGGTCSCPSPSVLMGNQCCIGPLCVPCTVSAGGADDQGAEQAVTDVAKMGINTFVVGIATDSSADGVLNQMAINGGEPQSGTTKYYPVSSTAQLVSTINSIAGQIVSCSLALTTPPVKPDLVTVTAGGAAVPFDPTHMNGWDYGPGMTSIIFYGSFCQQLQSGQISNVNAVYGCPPIN